MEKHKGQSYIAIQYTIYTDNDRMILLIVAN